MVEEMKKKFSGLGKPESEVNLLVGLAVLGARTYLMDYVNRDLNTLQTETIFTLLNDINYQVECQNLKE